MGRRSAGIWTGKLPIPPSWERSGLPGDPPVWGGRRPGRGWPRRSGVPAIPFLDGILEADRSGGAGGLLVAFDGDRQAAGPAGMESVAYSGGFRDICPYRIGPRA